MATAWDNSQCTQVQGTIPGGMRIEAGKFDLTDDVTEDYTIASHLSKMIAFVGQVECSVGCVSLQSRAVTNATFCAGLIEISIPDISAGTDSAELSYIAIGW